MILKSAFIDSILEEKFAKRLNIGLTISCCFLFLYLIIAIFSKPEGTLKSFLWTKKARVVLPELKLSKKAPKYYQRILGRRAFFVAQAGIVKKPDLPDSAFDSNAVSIIDLRIVGIVSGPQGPQAIVGNEKTGQSFYCSGGENLNGFLVKEVLSDRIILEKDDQTFEMRL